MSYTAVGPTLEPDEPGSKIQFEDFSNIDHSSNQDYRPESNEPPQKFVSFLQQYFDVNTDNVLMRSWASIFSRKNFFELVDNSPDFYGPFWITSTVVFALFFSSTIAGYVASLQSNREFHYDFTRLTAASSMMYLYLILAPSLLWLILRFTNCASNLAMCFCLYGYANTIWIPVAIASIAPFDLLSLNALSSFVRWLAVIIGFAVSLVFLCRNLWTVVNESENKSSRLALAFVAAVHAGFSIAFKLVFFDFSFK